MKFLKREIHIFFTSIMFYTRIPCPKWVDHDPKLINLSIRYFPLMGWIVGGISSLVFYFVGTYVSFPTAIILSLATSVLITGAFHEDGFADTCDAFGGGWTKKKILEIMKDSRLGTYGVIGLFLLMSLKIVLLYEFYSVVRQDVVTVVLFFITCHAISRFIASIFVFTHEYARDTADSKAKPVAEQTSLNNLFVGLLWTLIPLCILTYTTGIYWFFILYLPGMLVKYFLARYFKKWIGGYTGDCLGATQQAVEVMSYLVMIMIWKLY